jgi:toxin FitB
LSWVQKLPYEQVFLSAATVGELHIGFERTRVQNHAKADEIEGWLDTLIQTVTVLPMDAACFRQWATFMIRKSPDLVADAMIAATARYMG